MCLNWLLISIFVSFQQVSAGAITTYSRVAVIYLGFSPDKTHFLLHPKSIRDEDWCRQVMQKQQFSPITCKFQKHHSVIKLECNITVAFDCQIRVIFISVPMNEVGCHERPSAYRGSTVGSIQFGPVVHS